MLAKEKVCFTTVQIQRLCELHQGMDNLWNITSPEYHKRDKKNESLKKIKGVLVEEIQDIQPFTHKTHIYSSNVVSMQNLTCKRQTWKQLNLQTL